MRLSSNSTIIAVSLAHAGCFQQSFDQLSISDSQTSDSIQTNSDPTGVSTASSTTGSVSSGGISQTGNTSGAGTSMPMGETIETMTGLTAHGSSTSGTSTDAATIGTTSDQEVECYDVDKPLLLGGQCYSPSEVRRVFVTSETFNGAMNNPDDLCKKAAGTADVPDSDHYKSWTKIGEQAPSGRFDTSFSGPYVKILSSKMQSDDYVLVAMGWSELTSMELLSAIDVTEKWQTAEGFAWTGVKQDGSTSLGYDCGKWSNLNGMEAPTCEHEDNYGSVGIVGATGPSWSDAENLKCSWWWWPACCEIYQFDQAEIPECDSLHHLYCIQDKMTT